MWGSLRNSETLSQGVLGNAPDGLGFPLVRGSPWFRVPPGLGFPLVWGSPLVLGPWLGVPFGPDKI